MKMSFPQTKLYRHLVLWLALTAVVSTALFGCAAPVPPTASSVTDAAAADTPVTPAGADVSRTETLIIANEGSNVIAAPENFNPFVSGAVGPGEGQSVLVESLFYLNYESGEMMPWLAASYTFTTDYTGVDIVLREGITWSDGEPFTAGDVVFTINRLCLSDALSSCH